MAAFVELDLVDRPKNVVLDPPIQPQMQHDEGRAPWIVQIGAVRPMYVNKIQAIPPEEQTDERLQRQHVRTRLHAEQREIAHELRLIEGARPPRNEADRERALGPLAAAL